MTPVRVKASALFGGAVVPDGNFVTFGDYVYKTDAYQNDKKHLNLTIKTLFGGINLKTGKPDFKIKKEVEVTDSGNKGNKSNNDKSNLKDKSNDSSNSAS